MMLRGPHLAKAVVAIIAIGIVLFFFLQMQKTVQWPAAEYSRSDIVNLTTAKHPWQVYLGQPKLCGEIDCALKVDFSSPAMRTHVILPEHAFPMSGFTPGTNIFYRTQIKIPASMALQFHSVVFHSFFMWAKSYAFYINEELIETGASEQLNIVIPKKFLQSDKPLFISINVNADGLAYQGISHFGNVAIGPKTSFAPLKDRLRDAKTSNYLWSVLPKLTIAFVFCLVFLSLAKLKENFAFILFALTSALKPLAASAYGRDVFPSNWLAMEFNTLLDIYGQSFFILFVLMFYRVPARRVQLPFICWLLGISVLTYSASLYLAPDAFSICLNYVATSLRFLALTTAAIFSVCTAYRLRNLANARYRQNIAIGFAVLFLLALLALSLKKLGLGVPWGGSVENFYELMFFCVLTALLAIDFSRTDKQKSAFALTIDAQARKLEALKIDQAIAHTTRMIAHDVRKPFLQLRNVLTQLQTGMGKRSVEAYAYLQQIEKSIRNVDGMLKDIMEEGHLGKDSLTTVSIASLLHAAVEDINSIYPKHHVKFHWLDSDASILQSVNVHKFSRVLLNILDNAMQAMQFSGNIFLKWEYMHRDGKDVLELTLKNDGPLIAPIDREKLFTDYFSKGKAHGIGIGLMIAKRIMTAHGGDIFCISTLEKGTSFVLTLPKINLQPAQLSIYSERKLLVVIDDDIFYSEFWQKNVRNIDVQIFASPADFFAKINNGSLSLTNIDSIITDYFFDNDVMCGMQLAAKVRNLDAEICIFLSSSLQPDLTLVEKKVFDAVLDKKIYAWEELCALKANIKAS